MQRKNRKNTEIIRVLLIYFTCAIYVEPWLHDIYQCNSPVPAPPTQHGTINVIDSMCHPFLIIRVIRKLGLLHKPQVSVSPLPRDEAEERIIPRENDEI
ncbi:hypothetical protein TNCV_1217711 [Trichonephila clavipes]|nr:hypothetical protein TNCV_1217711 [Trichonephila clavipes]